MVEINKRMMIENGFSWQSVSQVIAFLSCGMDVLKRRENEFSDSERQWIKAMQDALDCLDFV